MKKFLLFSLGFLPLLFLAQGAHAQNYTYNCLCLYSDPRGTCREYTCDAYRNRRSYYYDDYRNCDSRYDNCSVNRSRYWNQSSQYYDSRYNYDWYARRYTTTRPSYYNYPYYNDYNYNHPYYY